MLRLTNEEDANTAKEAFSGHRPGSKAPLLPRTAMNDAAGGRTQVAGANSGPGHALLGLPVEGTANREGSPRPSGDPLHAYLSSISSNADRVSDRDRSGRCENSAPTHSVLLCFTLGSASETNR
jgi:hypothetical protein